MISSQSFPMQIMTAVCDIAKGNKEQFKADDNPAQTTTQHGWSVLTAVTKMRFSKVFAPFVNFCR